jgi:hypothetical protein
VIHNLSACFCCDMSRYWLKLRHVHCIPTLECRRDTRPKLTSKQCMCIRRARFTIDSLSGSFTMNWSWPRRNTCVKWQPSTLRYCCTIHCVHLSHFCFRIATYDIENQIRTSFLVCRSTMYSWRFVVAGRICSILLQGCRSYKDESPQALRTHRAPVQ